MQHESAPVVFPERLLEEVDSLVGESNRTAFLIDAVEKELHRRKLLAALREARGSWKTEDYPELAEGSEAYVNHLRAQNDARL